MKQINIKPLTVNQCEKCGKGTKGFGKTNMCQVCSRIGTKRKKYKIKAVNKGWFKNTGALKQKKCGQCDKEFNSYKTSDNQYCSTECYRKSQIGAKRQSHSKWMKEAHKKGIIKSGYWEGLKHSKESIKRMSIAKKKTWEDKNSKYYSEKYKQRQSDIMMNRCKIGKMNIGITNCKHGWYDINGKKIYFRSGWEPNYALYLDFLIKQGDIDKWEYEPETFWFDKIKRGVRSYKPDFKVYIKDKIEYHEVKGWMDSKSKTKLKRMAKYYPEVKMVLIDAPVYNDIKKKLGTMLKFY